jgi:carbamoyltransferase
MAATSQDTLFLLRQPSPHRMVIQYHPTIGHLFVPNLNARIPNAGGAYYVRTNAQGFRADANFTPQRSDRPRIVFLGDSLTAGDGVENAQRFTEGVGAALGAEVYNFAVSGTGTDQQLLIYEQFAANVEADLIVFCVNVGNMDRNKRSHRESVDRTSGKRVRVPKPYFEWDNGTLTLKHQPVPTERPPVLKREHSSGGPLRQIYNLPQMAPVRQLYRNSGLRGHLKRSSQPYPDYADPNANGWQLMQAILQRFINAAKPTPVLIVPVPTYRYFRDGAKPVYQARFNALADPANGVHVMDLTTPILNLPGDDLNGLMLPSDKHHLSVRGHQHIAGMLADSIRQRDLLPVTKAQPPAPTVNSHSGATYILGVSAFYHNSAAALIRDGEIIAAVEEERFTRVKNDRNFPHRAINYCLEEARIHPDDLTAVVYYDNAYLTFERLLHTQLAIGAGGREAWGRVLPSWLTAKLHIPRMIREALDYNGPILQDVHHRGHAASAFYPSPFERAAILTVDGVGEWATATIGRGHGGSVELLKEMHFPHSLGLLYSAFTQFTGFKVNSGEYKMMGLAPYGNPTYVDIIYKHLVDVKNDGSLALNLDYFSFLAAPAMTNDKFAALFGGPPRNPNSRITQRERDLARSVQVVTEDVMLKMAHHAHKLTGEKHLCLAGGVALNCVANGRLLREGPFDDIWIQPAAGDAGCALGAALDAYHTYYGHERVMLPDGRPAQGGSYWGPEYSADEIRAYLTTYDIPHHEITPEDRAATLAEYIDAGKVVGHFAGRLEFGPRALGSRSIIGDARNQDMQTTLNLKIKYRESFRPFAPTVLADCVSDYFELDRESPYMLLVADVQPSRRLPLATNSEDLLDIVRRPRSDIPAVTHVDYSARIQTITAEDHPQYHALLDAFRQRTGYGVIVNTSFNVRGEPIICTPQDAYHCFMSTEMDVLVMGNTLLLKEDQPEWEQPKGHREHFDAAQTPPANEPLLRDLLRVFDADFLPIAQQHPVGFSGGAGSMWVEHLYTDARAVFEIPAALDSANPDPDAMADALMGGWLAGELTGALRPVVVTLLALGIKHQPEAVTDATEDVSDAVYVMY